MKVNDRNLMAFSMSLCHQMNVDLVSEGSEKRARGTYVLVLQAHQILQEVKLEFEDMDSIWCEAMTVAITEIAHVTEQNVQNVRLMISRAAETLQNDSDRMLAHSMASAFKLHEVKEMFDQP